MPGASAIRKQISPAVWLLVLFAQLMWPEMARLTLARKIATIVLIVWKRGVCFDAQHLKPQTA